MELNSAYVIIADDFTGAADAAVQFAARESPARLVIDWHEKEVFKDAIAALVVDTDTRFLSPAMAYNRVFDVTKALYNAGARKYYKKIDSTLRGNPSEEIAAVLDAGGFRFAIIAPATPRNERIVKDGICYVRGAPLASSFAGKDPFTPVLTSHLRKIFQGHFGNAIAELPLSIVREGKKAIENKIKSGLDNGARIFIADAETMGDLEEIAHLDTSNGGLFVGSSGLAEALSEGKNSLINPKTAGIPGFLPHKMLFVTGSITAMSIAQTKRLISTGVSELVVDCEALIKDAERERRRLEDLLERQPFDRPLLVRTTSPKSGKDENNESITSNTMREQRAKISNFVGALTKYVIQRRKPELLFASGGDTAARIIEALGTTSIDFSMEILPGIPFGTFYSKAIQQKLYFVSKAGEFGNLDSLVTIMRKFTLNETGNTIEPISKAGYS